MVKPATAHGSASSDIVMDLDEEVAALSVPAACDPDVVLEDQDDEADTLPKQASRNDDGSVMLALLYPVKIRFQNGHTKAIREETTSELHMHRLRGIDLTAITNSGKADAAVTTLARSTRMPMHRMRAIHDQMDGKDVLAAMQVIDFFLPSGRATGR